MTKNPLSYPSTALLYIIIIYLKKLLVDDNHDDQEKTNNDMKTVHLTFLLKFISFVDLEFKLLVLTFSIAKTSCY